MIRAVIFDLDNTLTDFMEVKSRSIAAAVDAMIDAGLDAKLGMDQPSARQTALQQIQEVYEREGIEYQKVFNTYLKEVLGAVDYRLLAAGIVGYRRARDSNLVPYPHVHWTLHQLLRGGLKLAVVTDAPREQAWLRLVYLNLHHVFDAVVAYEDTGERKPDPAPFREALTRLSMEPKDTLMIGDWPDRDMAGAKAVGMTTVFAHYGYSWSKDRGPIEEHPADHEIHDIRELIEVIEAVNTKQEPVR